MKALFIGGTGTISMAITRALASDPNWDLYLLNRGNRTAELPEGVHVIKADINDEEAVKAAIADMTFDVVGEFIGFVPEQLERDVRLFAGKCKQYIYISSASAYQKPVGNCMITEGTPLANPYWEYSRNKIACEAYLMKEYRENGFPVTIVRPSHTYDERNLPTGVDGVNGCWAIMKRMMEGKPVLIQGDGTSLWTCTFNTDFAKGYIGLMGNIHTIGDVFHITSDEHITWTQIYQAVANALGVELKPYYVSAEFLDAVGPYDYKGSLIGDKSCSVLFDNSKLKTVVPDFCCTVRFDQGARKCVEYILSHPECQKEDPEFDAFCDKVIAALENAKTQILNA